MPAHPELAVRVGGAAPATDSGSRRSISFARRTWLRFKADRLGFWSLVIFAILLVSSLGAELISDSRPLLAHYAGSWYFPIFKTYSEADFGGVLRTEADFHEPFIQAQLSKPGNFALYPLNRWDALTLNYYPRTPHPAAPSAENWLGTDIIGRDVAARLLYAFRLSMLFGLGLTAVSTFIGITLGAVQGYFGGYTDLVTQRLIDIWGSLPELYMLTIVGSFFAPSLWLLFVLLSLFGWILLSDYVRAEFLRNRQLEYVLAARAMGLTPLQIIWRHVLPNSLVPVLTFIPFRVGAAITALTSLDFLGLGVQEPTPSLGELLAQGKTYLYAWWISIPTLVLLVVTLLLLTFIGDAVRNALDVRGGGRSTRHES